MEGCFDYENKNRYFHTSRNLVTLSEHCAFRINFCLTLESSIIGCVCKLLTFPFVFVDQEPCWSYEEEAAQNDTGFNDTICGAGDNFAYTRGNPREVMIRKASSQSYSKKLKVPYNLMHFKFDESGSKLIALGSNSKMEEQYKQVCL